MQGLLSRRDLLMAGGVSLLSPGLWPLLAAPRPRATAKACIILFQVGGPYQLDTFDPKPNAPEEMRGPYKPTRTPVPGIQISESLPKIAARADKFAIVRSVNHTIRCHNPAIYCSLVGREATAALAISNRTAARRTDHPHYASVVAKVRRSKPGMPHHVIVPDVVTNGPSRSPGLLAGYLGTGYDPFILGANPAAPDFRIDSVRPARGVNAARLDQRKAILAKLDRVQKLAEQTETLTDLQKRAFAMLTAPKTKKAFDLGQESTKLRDHYGRDMQGQSCLLARRLVEAGVPFVTVFSHTVVEKDSWDTHNKHDELSKTVLLPTADRVFSALLDDLQTRGLLDSTLVVWLGEFGRTPKRGVTFSNNTNNVGGRDHWCNCYSVVLAGGGVKGGKVVGSSDFIGGYPKSRPVHITDLAATIFHAMGVEPSGSVKDIQGQPHNICDGDVVKELF